MPDTILIVDDDPDIREIVRVNLEGVGYSVLTAADGATGLAVAQEKCPDLIILDVLMPELDGWQVLPRLAADPRTADCPVIVLTCKGDDQDVLRGLDLGAVDYLTKPFFPEDLVASVKIILDVFDSMMRNEHRRLLIARRKRSIERAPARSPV